jgi:hypothetical protein
LKLPSLATLLAGLLLVSLLQGCKLFDFTPRGEVVVDPGLDLRGATAVVLVEDASDPRQRQNTGLDTFSKVKIEAALQRAGLRVNDHAASVEVRRLLEEIRANQDPEGAMARLDQLGVDIMFFAEIGQLEVTNRSRPGKDEPRFNVSFSMTLRGVDPRSAESQVSGNTSFSRSIYEKADGVDVARDAIENLAHQLELALNPPKPEEGAAAPAR